MATTSYGSPYVSGSDLVAAWPAASLTVANAIDAAGYYIGRGINAQTASYQTVLTDAGKTISMTAAGATTLTIPANSSVAYVVGTRINILNLGAGACTPTAGAGVTINGTITALATNESASLVKTATNTWSYLVAATPAAPGLSLVTPTSVAGSGVTLSGGAVSFASATSVSVNGCFTSAYTRYRIVAGTAGVGGAAAVLLRFRVGGTDSSAASYWDSSVGAASNTAAAITLIGQSRTSSQLGITGSGVDLALALDVFDPLAAFTTRIIGHSHGYDGSTEYIGYSIGSVFIAATSFDGFTIFPAANSLTGILRVYGYRD